MNQNEKDVIIKKILDGITEYIDKLDVFDCLDEGEYEAILNKIKNIIVCGVDV